MFLKFLFYISAFLTVFGAISVVVTRNLIHSCVYLLFSLIGVAGLYLTLNAEFIAATQLVVYVGGIVVLLLFAIMLTGGSNLKVLVNKFGLESTPLMGNLKTYIFAALSGLVLAAVLIKILFSSLLKSSTVSNNFFTTVEDVGVKLLTDHILAFELSSVLLLGALVGAAIIARPQRSTEVEE